MTFAPIDPRDPRPAARKAPAPARRRRRTTWPAAAVVVLLAMPMLFVLGVAATPPSVYEMPDVQVRSLHADVRIDDALAVTQLTVELENTRDVARDHRIDLPLDGSAVLTDLRIEIDNRTLVGVVKDDESAREDYQDAVNDGRTAVLLQSAGRGRLAMTINIQAASTAVLDLTYVELLPANDGQRDHRLPLSGVHGNHPAGELQITFEACRPAGWNSVTISGLAMTQVAPTSAGCQRSERQWSDRCLGTDLTAALVADPDTVQPTLIISGSDVNASALLLMSAPATDFDALPKDVVFVLDRSGSMSGDKINDAKLALETVIGDLRPEDRFTVVSFSSDIRTWRSGLSPADADNVASARQWVRQIEEGGGTDIHSSLMDGLGRIQDTEGVRLPMVVLVTDGRPTVGVTGLQDILDQVHAANDHEARVHTVGIGFDADDAFLNRVAAETRGLYHPIVQGDDVQAQMGSFYAKISDALWKDVNIEVDGLDLQDVYPRPLPDIYAGSQLLLAARADTTELPAELRITLSGIDATGQSTHVTNVSRDDVLTAPAVAKLWARQKAAAFEYALGLQSPGSPEHSETAAALTEHGVRMQIATLRTSWIVVDEADADKVMADAQARAEADMASAAGTASPTATSTSAPTPTATGDANDVILQDSTSNDAPQYYGGSDGRAADSAGSEDAAAPGPSLALLVGGLVGLGMVLRRRP